METGDIWGSIAYDQIDFLAFEDVENCLRRLLGRDVAHDDADSRNCSNILQIDARDSNIVRIIPLFIILIQLLRQNLRPRSRSRAQINCLGHSFEDIEFLINLKQFEGTPGSEPLFLGISIILIVFAINLSFEKLLLVHNFLLEFHILCKRINYIQKIKKI